MSDSRALVSAVTMATDDNLRSDHLKLCVLWYDEILFEPLTDGRDDQAEFLRRLAGDKGDHRKLITHLADVIVPLHSRVSKDVIGDWLDDARKGYPRWDNCKQYTYPEPENAEQYAHNMLLHAIEAEHGVKRFEGIDVEHAEGRARVAVDAVMLWGRVNAELPCVLQAGNDEKVAMSSAAEFGLKTKPDLPVVLFECTIPSLRNVPWERIWQFRNDSGMASLREHMSIATRTARGDVEEAGKLIEAFEAGVTESIIEGSKPRVRTVALESVLTNLPIPYLNPFSAGFAIRDTASEMKKSKDWGWFYLLRDIRASSTDQS